MLSCEIRFTEAAAAENLYKSRSPRRSLGYAYVCRCRVFIWCSELVWIKFLGAFKIRE